MGPLLLLQLSLTPPPPPKPSLLVLLQGPAIIISKKPPTVCGARKNSGPTSNQRFRFHDNNYGDDDAFAKRRVWWVDVDDDVDFDDDDESDGVFWIFKILRSFGWMFPALAVSLLLGTGDTNAFYMALAVPLGQTALSLVLDKVWESSRSNSRPRARPRARAKTRKKPFAGAPGRTNTREQYKTGDTRGSYQSWVATDGVADKKTKRRGAGFGGWDELDEGSYKVPRGTPHQMFEAQAEQQNKDKLSRKIRMRDKPLLIRLLVAVFPFLGSWTKLFWFSIIPD